MKQIIVREDHIVGPWVCERTGGTYVPGDSSTMGLADAHGNLVGGVLFDHYNGRSIAMHVAGDGRRWLNREFIRACFDYVFNQLGVHKVIGMVPSWNKGALRFDFKLGFEKEAVIEDAVPGGDLIILSMTRDQCRWLSQEQ